MISTTSQFRSVIERRISWLKKRVEDHANLTEKLDQLKLLQCQCIVDKVCNHCIRITEIKKSIINLESRL